VEVMLISGRNDSEQALTDLAAALQRIQPDQIHLNLPVRPPSEPWVKPPADDKLMQAVAILGDVARIVHPVEGDFSLDGFDDVVDAILAVISRHPMRQTELMATLSRWSSDEVGDALVRLQQSGRAQIVERFSERFWTSASARYVNERQHQQN
jgi:wyosine [tRNA(Phe)-imidazoG37] synthetase (radical SAM superfamily)